MNLSISYEILIFLINRNLITKHLRLCLLLFNVFKKFCKLFTLLFIVSLPFCCLEMVQRSLRYQIHNVQETADTVYFGKAFHVSVKFFCHCIVVGCIIVSNAKDLVHQFLAFSDILMHFCFTLCSIQNSFNMHANASAKFTPECVSATSTTSSVMQIGEPLSSR